MNYLKYLGKPSDKAFGNLASSVSLLTQVGQYVLYFLSPSKVTVCRELGGKSVEAFTQILRVVMIASNLNIKNSSVENII